MTIKSPLRYPGGKSKAVKHILPFIPKYIKRLCSPFLGGASVELACAERGIEVYGYDSFSLLIDFWQNICIAPANLSDKVDKHCPIEKKEFLNIQKTIKTLSDPFDRAAFFFILNRASFSGTTLSGGMSPNHPRFNPSSIERLRNFPRLVNFHVDKKDFRESIDLHKDDFLYVDPPYLIEKSLYGINGDHHKGFDHLGLAKLLHKRDQWILSYNGCDAVRNLYKDFHCIALTWAYGMNKSKKSNEFIILSHDISTLFLLPEVRQISMIDPQQDAA